MFGSHGSLLARHIGPLHVFFLSEMGSCLYWSISLLLLVCFFFQNSSRCSDPGISFFLL